MLATTDTLLRVNARILCGINAVSLEMARHTKLCVYVCLCVPQHIHIEKIGVSMWWRILQGVELLCTHYYTRLCVF